MARRYREIGAGSSATGRSVWVRCYREIGEGPVLPGDRGGSGVTGRWVWGPVLSGGRCGGSVLSKAGGIDQGNLAQRIQRDAVAAEPERGVRGGPHVVAWHAFDVLYFVDGQGNDLRAGLHQQHGRTAMGKPS